MLIRFSSRKELALIQIHNIKTSFLVLIKLINKYLSHKLRFRLNQPQHPLQNLPSQELKKQRESLRQRIVSKPCHNSLLNHLLVAKAQRLLLPLHLNNSVHRPSLLLQLQLLLPPMVLMAPLLPNNRLNQRYLSFVASIRGYSSSPARARTSKDSLGLYQPVLKA